MTDPSEAKTAGSTDFGQLIAPTVLGGLALRNRMVMAPMGTNFASNGYVTQRSIDYYEARAAGGAGMIIVEGSCVEHPRGIGISQEQGIDHDRFLPGLSEVAAVIKARGARALVQLHHSGREALPKDPGIQLVAPSAIRSINPSLSVPHALTVDEIHAYVERFVDAAARARRAGFEGVEVHGAHSYLVNQFLSPLCNTRTDEYGGSLENRTRFAIEIVRGIKGRLGANFPVGMRLSGEEMVEGGMTIDQTCAVARLLEPAGIDYVHVTVSGPISPLNHTIGSAAYQRGYLLESAAKMKQAIGIPVIGVGRINTPLVAQQAIANGKCDLVALGRALVADPEFPNKVATGRVDEIRPCIACLTCINTVSVEEQPLVCRTNPAAGREREFVSRPAARPKKVFVIGGGVAGMEAARTAALRGHEVTVLEQGDRLGGQLNAASVPPFKELDLLRRYYAAQMAKSTAVVRLNETADASSIAAAKPDVVIIATGKHELIPKPLQTSDPKIVIAEDVLLGKTTVGPRVVVVGGGSVGCETAEHLVSTGAKQVTVVEMLGKIAADEMQMTRGPLLRRLRAVGIQLLTGTRAEGIDADGLVVSSESGSRVLPADSIVLATGSRANDQLLAALHGKVPDVRVVGDAAKPRRLVEAIREGLAAGLAV